MKKEVYDCLTKKNYDLEHLHRLHTSFTIRLEEVDIKVPMVAMFSNHCYTASRKEGQPNEAVLYEEQRHNGEIDERVFCLPRWKSSRHLPQTINELHNKRCLLGNGAVFYRQEGVPSRNNHAGWYICACLGVSNSHKNLTLNVRSLHWRENRPSGLRGHPRPFFAILTDYYRKQRGKRDWLE
ncbi:MAG: hypothetical protein RPU35_16990 [Candidatus Sedimenticola sp. (ex Thyasira tokunagai)]